MRLRAIILSAVILLGSATPALADTPVVNSAPARSIIYTLYDNGQSTASGNINASIPTESQSKLFLAYYVLQHGTEDEKSRIPYMISVSSDRWADILDSRYPQAIDSVAGQFGLTGTKRGQSWGFSHTTAFDLARFLKIIRDDPIAAPIREGMEHWAPVAADGYHQGYGSATVAGARGSKFGWSDNGDDNISTTYGDGWVMVAHTYGSAADNTDDVRAAISYIAPQPATPTPTPTATPLEIALGNIKIPAVRGIDLKNKLRCVQVPIDDDQLLPAPLVNILPQC
ncbi:MAG: hypothetical protein Q3961_02825 [Bifidobacteriaceae bacterium]|nr:hypothetical protein [Bifidobacteriaceae bacterium]